MKDDEILQGLEKIAESLGMQLRYEKGDFAGGSCVLEGKHMLFIPSGLAPAQKTKVLARELAQMNLENIFIVPALREVIAVAVQTLELPEENSLVENISQETLN